MKPVAHLAAVAHSRSWHKAEHFGAAAIPAAIGGTRVVVQASMQHVKRAKVIMATDGCGTSEIMRQSELSKPVVWRWQERS